MINMAFRFHSRFRKAIIVLVLYPINRSVGNTRRTIVVLLNASVLQKKKRKNRYKNKNLKPISPKKKKMLFLSQRIPKTTFISSVCHLTSVNNDDENFVSRMT